MPRNTFDQASRYAVRLDSAGFLGWALNLPTAEIAFRGWLDTRGVPFPGELDRTGDTVAHLADAATNLTPWAVAVEFQAEPDPVMFGRLMVYLGYLWLTLKPDPERGSRFRLGAVVVNLTGTGYATRRMGWPAAGLETALVVRERNLEDESAEALLDDIAGGRRSRGLLPWIPLMTGGDEPGIISGWKRLAEAEPDAKRRAEYAGLAKALAAGAKRGAVWKNALRDWNMLQSEAVMEWQEEGRVHGRATALLDALEVRFGAVPPDLIAAVMDVTDSQKLRGWLKDALKVASLDEFRKLAGV